MQHHPNRREFLAALGPSILASTCPFPGALAATPAAPGVITGSVLGDEVGRRVLSEGGNAVDAVVAAALVSCVTNLSNCGIGGYGGHMSIALADGRVSSIDFNSTAPFAVTPELFAASDSLGGYNQRGWLSAGVPGVLHGVQLAIDKFGTRSIADVLQPAISYARDGFPLPPSTAGAIRRFQKQFLGDPGSSKLLLPDGKLPKAGSTFRNLDLASMLEALADAGTVEPFYRGEFARRIAAAFEEHGGLLTTEDMAQYRARVVRPAHLHWRGNDIYTAPLTAGGVTSLQILKLLDALDWFGMSNEPAKTHAELEAHRIAWHDRLTWFGDPDFVEIPLEKFLSNEYAKKQANRIHNAVREKRMVHVIGAARDHGGTCHISAADRAGNLVSMTFTHGQGFGALVTVDGLGLILGHGVSRFDADPDHPNSPGPGKRPLNNMCPTVVVRDGRPVLAIGGRGGRRIPNAIACVLRHYAGEGLAVQESVAAKRLHTEGDHVVTFQGERDDETVQYLKSLGYAVNSGKVARVDAASFDPSSAAMATAFN